MASFLEMFYALSDSFAIALSSLNPIALIIFSVLMGLFQSKREGLTIKTLGVVIPSVVISIFLPFFSGIDRVFFDVLSPEFQIQFILSVFIAAFIIGILGWVKSAISFINPERSLDTKA